MAFKKEINIRVGKNIQLAREKAGYTQEKLSELLEITPNHLSAIERGASGIKLETMDRLCRLLGISADALLLDDAQRQDNWEHEIAVMAGKIDPIHRPQIEKILAALLEMSRAQESREEV